VRRVTSRQNALVARFRAAARGEADGLVLLDGVHLLAEALAAGLRIREAAVASHAVDREDLQPIIRQLTTSGIDVVEATTAVMAALSPVRSSSPLVGLADRPTVTRGHRDDVADLLVIAVDVQDPGNVGAIVRVAEAGGATAVVTAGASADPFGWKALRGSMGSALRIPIEAAQDASRAVAEARQRGCRIVTAVPRAGRSAFEVDYMGPTAIVIGGEGQGLSASLLDAADERVTIPMATPVESLNAAVTAALIIYEARRQRSAREVTN
jgi:TrmH family RNA methyltransferase